MSAIMISDLMVLNEEAFQSYRTRAAKAITQFGGRYLARNGEVRVLEGRWQPTAVVVVQFTSLEQAEAWYQSPGVRSCTGGSGSRTYPQPHSCRRL